jgi:hypothetical protein
MPEKQTLKRARKAKAQGKAPSTQAGEFVREEIHHVRERKHGARSTKQAIAIGLSKARRAGVELAPPPKATTSSETRRQAERDLERGHRRRPQKPSPRRKRAALKALEREGTRAASRQALAAQAHEAAEQRGARQR